MNFVIYSLAKCGIFLVQLIGYIVAYSRLFTGQLKGGYTLLTNYGVLHLCCEFKIVAIFMYGCGSIQVLPQARNELRNEANKLGANIVHIQDMENTNAWGSLGTTNTTAIGKAYKCSN